MKIGILSDTHGYLDEQIYSFFHDSDEIWHAGDIGSIELLRKLQDFKPIVAVFGNIDGSGIRAECKLNQRLIREGIDIWMTHIGGYPGNYYRTVREEIKENPPDLFISGHSHILKVIPDKKLGLLHINPGAAGYIGMHKVRTAVRFDIIDKKITNLDLVEFGPRSIQKKT
jgi:putative phosphoesterase